MVDDEGIIFTKWPLGGEKVDLRRKKAKTSLIQDEKGDLFRLDKG